MFKKMILLLLCALTVSAADKGDKHTLLWIDLEMTDLSPEKDLIIQAAAMVTDDDLNVVAEFPEQEIHYDKLPEMNSFVVNMHTKNGLLEKMKKTTTTLSDVEDGLIKFYNTHCAAKNDEQKPILCGHCVWHDRKFLDIHMPKFAALLHYVILDVAAYEEGVKRWHPEEYKKREKSESNHTARWDIVQSIADLKFYKQVLSGAKQ
jgi:oligoribonuclease